MTPEDVRIWKWLRSRSAVARVAYSYLSGAYWLVQARGLIGGLL